MAILIPTIIAAGLAYPTFGEGLHYVFVKVLGEGTANMAVGLITGLFLWGAVNGLQAAAVFFGLLITGGIIWISIKKLLWDHRPKIFQKTTTESIETTPFRQTTPTGATLRPTNTTSESTPTSPPETVIKEEKEQ